MTVEESSPCSHESATGVYSKPHECYTQHRTVTTTTLNIFTDIFNWKLQLKFYTQSSVGHFMRGFMTTICKVKKSYEFLVWSYGELWVG